MKSLKNLLNESLLIERSAVDDGYFASPIDSWYKHPTPAKIKKLLKELHLDDTKDNLNFVKDGLEAWVDEFDGAPKLKTIIPLDMSAVQMYPECFPDSADEVGAKLTLIFFQDDYPEGYGWTGEGFEEQ